MRTLGLVLVEPIGEHTPFRSPDSQPQDGAPQVFVIAIDGPWMFSDEGQKIRREFLPTPVAKIIPLVPFFARALTVLSFDWMPRAQRQILDQVAQKGINLFRRRPRRIKVSSSQVWVGDIGRLIMAPTCFDFPLPRLKFSSRVRRRRSCAIFFHLV